MIHSKTVINRIGSGKIIINGKSHIIGNASMEIDGNGNVGEVVSKNGNVSCQTVEGSVTSKNGNVSCSVIKGDCDTKNGNIMRGY